MLNAEPGQLRVIGVQAHLVDGEETVSASVTVAESFQVAVPVPAGATREQRMEARLRAFLRAAELVAEDMDDDGEVAVVMSPRLRTLLGFARRNRQDLEGGGI